jgi:hypothetical protein
VSRPGGVSGSAAAFRCGLCPTHPVGSFGFHLALLWSYSGPSPTASASMCSSPSPATIDPSSANGHRARAAAHNTREHDRLRPLCARRSSVQSRQSYPQREVQAQLPDCEDSPSLEGRSLCAPALESPDFPRVHAVRDRDGPLPPTRPTGWCSRSV